MEVKGESYLVNYDPDNNKVVFTGMMRLRGATEYTPITDLLDLIVAKSPKAVTLDLCDLQFLNSSGINFLFRFVIQLRDLGDCSLDVIGSTRLPWQEKSLPNLLKLMEKAQLTWN